MATATSQVDCNTGTQNHQYNLISILYHALEGAATCEQYIVDAKNAGDRDLANFFERVKAENCDRAEQAKALLKTRL